MAEQSGAAPIIVRTNIADFKAQIDQFKYQTARTIVRSALAAAARVFKKAIVAAAPVLKERNKRKGRRAGALKESIYVFNVRRAQAGSVQYVVSFKKKNVKTDPFYGRFLETGWMPRGPGKKIRGGKRYATLQRQRNRAAGHRFVQYQFVKPAADKAHVAALQAFNDAMERGIANAQRKASFVGPSLPRAVVRARSFVGPLPRA